MSRSINNAGLNLVKKFEGFSPEAYLCPAGVLTIGYGHTGGVSPGQTMTKEEAEAVLRQDLAESVTHVERLITVPLTSNQFSALVSFVFNVGAGNLQSSTLKRKLNAGNYGAVPSELARWVKITDPVTKEKKTMRGLVRRRAAEAELWLTPDKADSAEGSVAMPQRVENADPHDDPAVPTIEQITNTMRRLGYKIFRGKDRTGHKRNYDLNIFGVRAANIRAGAFDDWIGVFWMNWDTGGWEFHIWNATTDPGTYWLNQPLNVSGTAILVPDQYRSSYQIGLHRNKYEALVQCKPIKVYRDNNKDDVLDMMPDTIQRGLFGINIHRASTDHRSVKVEKWSAGCQVIADPRCFARLMDICNLAEYEWGPIFSYTLLTQEQLAGQ
ncbi:lysozyme [Desulfonema magnum]|uniref:Lysozyme n=1 Tax=Desulfonema magnum TaxID=45655 RepID=A0A975BH44_9BACT|nr:lysozyme [Desulfonema magnum]QTA85193.1 Glycoside hydrolase, family 24 [Desulfonema magnum]